MDNTTLLGILFASASLWLVAHGLLALVEIAFAIRHAFKPDNNRFGR